MLWTKVSISFAVKLLQLAQFLFQSHLREQGINPLLNVAFGMILFHERLRPAQILALAFGTLAVAILIVAAGQIPWIALSLAVTFATYGLLRKIAPADAIVGLSIARRMRSGTFVGPGI